MKVMSGPGGDTGRKTTRETHIWQAQAAPFGTSHSCSFILHVQVPGTVAWETSHAGEPG